jgi:hypothetical protein
MVIENSQQIPSRQKLCGNFIISWKESRALREKRGVPGSALCEKIYFK